MRKLIDLLFSDKQYDWLLRNLPHRVMYHKRWIDSQHQMWVPRWGASKIMMEEAEKRAEETFKNIKFK